MERLHWSGSELCLRSDTLLNEDALPHRSRREQGAGGTLSSPQEWWRGSGGVGAELRARCMDGCVGRGLGGHAKQWARETKAS